MGIEDRGDDSSPNLPYSLAVPHFVRYYTASKHRIHANIVRKRKNTILNLFFKITNMWPFSKKNIISPNHPKYQQIMDGLQDSQVDITDRFWDNLRLKPDEWIVTKPLNLMVKNPESTGLPPVDSSPEEVYEAAKKLSATREQINTKLVPYDGVYCPVCHIANTQLSKLHSPCPKCGRGLLKFGWD